MVKKLKNLKKSGFSVVELVVVITILAMVFTGVIYVFIQSRNSQGSSESRMTVLHQGRMLLEYLKRDLRSIHAYDGEFAKNGEGFSFARCSGTTGDLSTLDEISYGWDNGGKTVTRESRNTGTHTFGGENVQIIDFAVVKKESKIGLKRCVYFDVTLELTDPNRNPDNSLVMHEKIFPPGLKSLGERHWLP
jgi:prepilin-type N-terminal cleavage/methylation domain-containing protein